MATGPAYMNATPHHSKVRASLTLSSALFVAGEDITGKMEVECRAEKEVGISLIMVELFAIQELNSRDHSATSTYIHTRRLFQGPDLPPSNAVHAHPTPGDPSLPPSYFPARRGITTFFFRFPVPLSSPSSISFASGLAKIRYEIRASVGVVYRGEKRLVTSSVDADVVQCEDMEGTVEEHIVVGDNGKMYMRGKILGGRLVTGEQSCLEFQVKNHTPKKTAGLSLTLSRSLRLHGAASNVPVQLSDSLFSETFRGSEYSMQPGTEGVANLVFKVPNAARVVKGGIREGSEDSEGNRKCTEPLFEIRCILGVKISMGLGNKDIVFEMPVQLSHRAALPEVPPDMDPYDPIPYEAEPVYDYTYPYMSPPLSASPYYQTPPQHPAYVSPPHDQRLQSPLQRVVSPIPYFLPDPNQQYYYPPPPVGLIPFAYPTRPSSAGAQPFYHMSPQPTGLPDTHKNPVFSPSAHVPEIRASVTTQQNIPPAQDPGLEEGKGERASRISHHLHNLTRARSMSPTSHRFPVPPPGPPAFTNSTPQRPHATSPRHALPVLSPRPLASPGNSFTAELPGANLGNGTTRSDRVDLLERLVDLGPEDEGKSPAKSVLRPSPMARRISTDGKGLIPPQHGGRVPAMPVSGLDALEKRLLQEVGTRKPETAKRPTLFSLGFTPTPNTVSAATSGAPPLAPMNLRDSEMSDFALTSPSYGSPASPQPRTGSGPIHGKEEKVKEHEVHKLRKAAKGRVADWLDGLGAPSDVMPGSASSTSEPVRKRKNKRSKSVGVPTPSPELFKSPAKGPIPPKKPDLPPRKPVKKASLYTSVSLPSTALPASPTKPLVPPSLPQPKNAPPLKDKLSEAKPRTLAPPGPAPDINRAMRRLELPSSKSIPETKYDVRSARGGKGGIATSVAALWTSLAEENSGETSAPPVHKPAKKATNTPPVKRPAVLDIGKSKPSPSAGTPRRAVASAPITAPAPTPAPVSAPAPPAQVPRNAIKSTSAPATVIPSHATPQLSSTASLARPIISRSPRVKPPSLSPTLEDGADFKESEGPGRISSPPPPPLREMAFGQARLKDLIKKYQQAAS
ncbi:hypothetical protein BU17DRAFT_40645 [Hysterangium stoloniferum]|nr:hypothetical protein BU17DRAFT_40645 [Hysterangium stoloniferum]